MSSDFRTQHLAPVVDVPHRPEPTPVTSRDNTDTNTAASHDPRAAHRVDALSERTAHNPGADTTHDDTGTARGERGHHAHPSAGPPQPVAPDQPAEGDQDPAPAAGPRPRTVRPIPATRRPRSVNAPAREGWRGAVNSLGLRLQPGAAEKQARSDIATVCGNLQRAVTVMVANPDGGAGKTPTTMWLSGCIGIARGGGVVAWDNNESRGDLGQRSEDGGSSATIRDLLVDPDRHAGRKEVIDRYLRHQPAGKFKVLASATVGGDKREVSRAEFLEVHDLLTAYYDVLVVDTGNNEVKQNWLALREVADLLVVPVKWKFITVNKALGMLDELREDGYGHLVESAIVVGTNGPADATRNKTDLAAYKAAFEQAGVAGIIDIPTDAHIHADAVLTHDALRDGTQRAGNRVAAAGFTHLTQLQSRHTRDASARGAGPWLREAGTGSEDWAGAIADQGS